MTNAVIECILGRSAAKYCDPAVTLSDDQIREMVRVDTTAPTSFHRQNLRFLGHLGTDSANPDGPKGN